MPGVIMATAPVRVGIVGCGSVMQGPYMGQLERLRGRGEAEVVVACDLDARRGPVVQERFGIPRFSTDAGAVIEADDVDLVLVLTSVAAHGSLASAALRAGKHVLVEKPMATDLDAGRELLSLAREHDRILLCAPHVVLSPTYQAIWRLIRAGTLGRPYAARARYGWAGPDWDEWFYSASGGALFDIAMYNITALTGLLGPVRRVSAMTGIAIAERTAGGSIATVEAEDNAQLLLDHGDGVLSSVTAGFTMQQTRSPAIEVYGAEGTVQLLGDDWAPQGYDLWTRSVGAWRHYKDLDPAWLWTDGLRHAVECIRDGRRPVIRPEHAFHALEVVIRAREASATGTTQPVTSTFDDLDLGVAEADEPVHLRHNLRQ
jgi:predicted dehydrogenase